MRQPAVHRRTISTQTVPKDAGVPCCARVFGSSVVTIRLRSSGYPVAAHQARDDTPGSRTTRVRHILKGVCHEGLSCRDDTAVTAAFLPSARVLSPLHSTIEPCTAKPRPDHRLAGRSVDERLLSESRQVEARVYPLPDTHSGATRYSPHRYHFSLLNSPHITVGPTFAPRCNSSADAV